MAHSNLNGKKKNTEPTKAVIKKDIERKLNDKDYKAYLDRLDRMFQLHKRAGIPQANSDAYDASDYSTPTYKKFGFDEQQYVQMLIDVKYSTKSRVAEKYGFTRLFPNDPKKIQNIFLNMENHFKDHYEKFQFYITMEEFDELKVMIMERADEERTFTASNPGTLTKKSIRHIIAKPISDMAAEMQQVNHKYLNLLSAKADTIKTKKDLKSEDIKKLADVTKITYDMSRLASGEATQYIGHIVKTEGIDTMDKSELIDILNNTRAAYSASTKD